jgi:hypothetical protein
VAPFLKCFRCPGLHLFLGRIFYPPLVFQVPVTKLHKQFRKTQGLLPNSQPNLCQFPSAKKSCMAKR